jgi:hypothetical protein
MFPLSVDTVLRYCLILYIVYKTVAWLTLLLEALLVLLEGLLIGLEALLVLIS